MKPGNAGGAKDPCRGYADADERKLRLRKFDTTEDVARPAPAFGAGDGGPAAESGRSSADAVS